MRLLSQLAAIAACLSLPLAGTAAAKPNVVVSILPVAAIVAGVMEGVDTPSVIVRGNASPHGFALRPSDARALGSADLIFWIGPSYETFLQRPLAGLGGRTQVVELARSPGVTMLPARGGGGWEADHDHGPPAPRRGRPADIELDGHMFLAPDNAKAIAQAAAVFLGAVDQENGPHYRYNARRLAERIDALDGELELLLEPVKNRPFIVFHDAYQYLERRYGLTAVGSVTVSAERAPGAQRLRELRRKITDAKAVCVFSEPQFQPAVVKTLVEGTRAKTAVLDPLGAGLPIEVESYFKTMGTLARALAGCLVD